MCGVFGWVMARGELYDEHLQHADNATKSLHHRGPDGHGRWLNSNVYMGHRRLKIIDLSDAASQPFVSQDGRYVLSYNGELYNYIELRAELEKEGVAFHTSSDTEVFLAAFIHWGHDAFNRFDGMFAAAIHDTQTGAHTLVRDPLGQKPLYYCAQNGQLLYGSELRCLVDLEGHDWRLNREAFLRFLMNGYYVWDDTPVIGIHKLLAGCWLRYERGEVRLERYFESVPGNDVLDISPEEAVDETERLIEKSCEISLRADVPYGVFLSGGVDSSLIAAICRDLDPNLAAFSVGMEDADYDESGTAREVARLLDIRNHRVHMLGADTIKDCFEEFLSCIDEPHGDPGFVNALFISRACRSDITVALAGDGGDEMFAGYLPFKGLALERYIRHLPAPALSLLRAGVSSFLPAKDTYLGLRFKALSYLQGFPAPDVTRFPLWLGALPPEDLAKLTPWASSDFFSRSGSEGTLFDFSGQLLHDMEDASQQQRLLYFYQKTFLPEFVCLHTDRASMQHSLEVRCPFLSAPLIRFANRLPDSIRIKDGNLKWPLKAVLERRGFPESIRGQAKRGFTFPVARWLKGMLRPYAEDAFECGILDELISREELRKIWEGHCEGRHNAYRILLNLVSFAAWLRRHPSVSCN
ncbi:MAG: asparagine synthase (glutamine-hydrolyzing) [Pseudodesulfovibrio sp.]